jgi:aspartyl-tRNA(Asn)/glutamyl-tRNA(Gln) amidotransferase subunit A
MGKMLVDQRSAGDSKTQAEFFSIEALSGLYSRKELSPVEQVTRFFERISLLNVQLNAYLTITREQAISAARSSEHRFQRGAGRGPLDGIPIAIKDNIWTQGVRTTAGSKFLADFIPRTDSRVVGRLRRAGAIILGKTNLHEFAYGVTSENPHYGAVRNPWDTSRIAGGSSGGSAVAVAAGLCAAALGTDTGGSVRIPAALCGVVGLKPTFGRVSCCGTVPLAPSFDHVGPIARTVGDAALLLGVMAGRDAADAATLAQPRLRPFGSIRELSSRLRPRFTKRHLLRLGWPREYFFDRVADDVRRSVEAAACSFEEMGAIVEEVSLPHVFDGDEPSTTMALAEATHVHRAAGWFPQHEADYGEDVRTRLKMGDDIRAAAYLAALEVRRRVRTDFETALEKVDAIIAPTVPVTAPRLGEAKIEIGGAEETVRSALIRLNRPGNFTGLPAISIPCGWTRAGLPIGLQLLGRAWQEERLLGIARLFEEAHPELRRRPKL